MITTILLARRTRRDARAGDGLHLGDRPRRRFRSSRRMPPPIRNRGTRCSPPSQAVGERGARLRVRRGHPLRLATVIARRRMRSCASRFSWRRKPRPAALYQAQRKHVRAHQARAGSVRPHHPARGDRRRHQRTRHLGGRWPSPPTPSSPTRGQRDPASHPKRRRRQPADPSAALRRRLRHGATAAQHQLLPSPSASARSAF